MNAKRTLTLLTAAAATTALALPGAAAAVPGACVTSLPSPGDDGWKIDFDGALQQSVVMNGGINFEDVHGRLRVEGAVYPAIPADQQVCDKTSTSITFPARDVGGVSVRRSITSVGGRLRHVDAITNTTNALKQVDVEFDLRVTGSQVVIDSEAGAPGAVTDDDHWSVHENSGTSFPFLQWGQDGAAAPAKIVSLGSDPATWKPDIDVMPDGILRYENVTIAPSATVRLVHMSGTTGSQSASRDAATDTVTPFTGLTKSVAQTVVNWGDDPDGDGVGKADDDCPAQTGNAANGCLQFVFVPPGNGGGAGDGGTPQPAGDAGASGGAGAGGGAAAGGGSGSGAPRAADTVAPAVRLTGVPSRVRRSRLTSRRGITARLACSEACRLRVRLQVRRRGARRATTILSRTTKLSSARRSVRLKVSRRTLRRLARQQVSLVVVATDAAGNARTLRRTVRLAG
jgi:hypothetical protein